VRADGGIVQGDLTVSPPPGAPASWTTATLVQLLYRRCFLGQVGDDPGADSSANADGTVAWSPGRAVMAEALREADGGRWIWEPGWWLDTRWPDGTATLVDEHGVTLHVRQEEYRTHGVEGSRVLVRFPTARPYLTPGFATISGKAGLAVGTDIVDWYLDILPNAAPDLLRALIQSLDGSGTRYTVKILDDPARYPRPDAAVLHASRRDVATVHRAVLDLHETSPEWFRPEIPLFTLRAGVGIGVAEHPPRRTIPLSFGQHRCRVLAKGIVDAGPDADARSRFRSMMTALADAGVSVHAPHLNPGSAGLDLPSPDGQTRAA
jgi:hypothetical protein